MKYKLTSSNGSQLIIDGIDKATAIEYFLTNIDSNGSKQLTVKQIKGWFSNPVEVFSFSDLISKYKNDELFFLMTLRNLPTAESSTFKNRLNKKSRYVFNSNIVYKLESGTIEDVFEIFWEVQRGKNPSPLFDIDGPWNIPPSKIEGMPLTLTIPFNTNYNDVWSVTFILASTTSGDPQGVSSISETDYLEIIKTDTERYTCVKYKTTVSEVNG